MHAQEDEPLHDLELIIIEKAAQFFESNEAHCDLLANIINGDSEISIRVIDWFTSNYSKAKGTKYIITRHGVRDLFRVNEQYNMQMKAHKKKCFDPFCRKKKVIVRIKREGRPSIKLSTSVGQLNFFQWAIKNNVIRYISDYLEQIEEHMRSLHHKQIVSDIPTPARIRDPDAICELASRKGLTRLNLTDPMPICAHSKQFRTPKEQVPIMIRSSRTDQ